MMLCMDIFDLYQKFLECRQEVSTDTRTMMPGAMYFGWKGESADGNVFAGEALEKGARYVVIDNPDYYIDERTIVVPDTLQAFQQLARHHRRQFNIPVIAIAGSNGKTTTKDLVNSILSQQKDTVASISSLNNHTGVPKTLFRIHAETDIVIVEMGANHVGEIADLCEIAEPTHGLVTNIGRDHIGYFGDQTAIIEANAELYYYLQTTGGKVLVNKNNMTLMKFSGGNERLCYGEGLLGESGVTSLGTTPYVSFHWKHYTIETQLTGEYNIENINAAIAVAVHFNILDEYIIRGVVLYQPTSNRSELVPETEKGNIVVKDYYNANRTSMHAALLNLAALGKDNPAKKTIAILGDMLELGDYSSTEHQAVVDIARELGVDKLILVGPDFSATHHGDAQVFLDVNQAIVYLQEQQISDSVILLKSSKNHPRIPIFQNIFDAISW